MDKSRKIDRKIDILLHYERSFREDWRFLHRLRVLVAGAMLMFMTSFIGWIVTKYNDSFDLSLKFKFMGLVLIFTIFSALTFAWFAASLNMLKQFLVKIEKSLGLFDQSVYLPEDFLLPQSVDAWGKRGFWRWGKSVFVCIAVGLIFMTFILML